MTNLIYKIASLLGMLSFLFISSSFAQKEDALWFCANNLGIDFRDPLNPKIFDSGQGERVMPASICDSQGNLFYFI